MSNPVKFDKGKPETWPSTSESLMVWSHSPEGGWWTKARWSLKHQCFRDTDGRELVFATDYMALTPPTDQPDTVTVPRVLDAFDDSWFKGLLFDAESESMNGPEVWKEIITHFEAKEQSE